MKIAITGATGYIGQALCRVLVEKHAILALSRNAPAIMADQYCWAPYTLEAPLNELVLQEVGAVIHLAAFTKYQDASTHAHERHATQQLLDWCARHRVPFLYVSSLSARADSPAIYGRTKYAIEQMVMGYSQGAVIRLGLVCGGAPQGVYGQLCRWVQKSPVLPFFIPPLHVQPVLLTDAVRAIQAVIEHQEVGMFEVAAEPLSLSVLLGAIAKYEVLKRRLFLPVPWRMAALCARVVPLGFSASQFMSLASTPCANVERTQTQLGIVPAPVLPYLLQRALPGIRLCEAFALLRYVGFSRPSLAAVRRYCADSADQKALVFPAVYRRFPFLLARFDRKGTLFHQRAGRAFLIHEARAEYGASFYAPLSSVRRVVLLCASATAIIFWWGVQQILRDDPEVSNDR